MYVLFPSEPMLTGKKKITGGVLGNVESFGIDFEMYNKHLLNFSPRNVSIFFQGLFIN